MFTPSSPLVTHREPPHPVHTFLPLTPVIEYESKAERESITDDRIANVARDLRRAYRSRLSLGCGFDDGHRQMLKRIQMEELRARNRPGGYWIAGDAPDAAMRGIAMSSKVEDVRKILLYSDDLAKLGESPAKLCRNFDSIDMDTAEELAKMRDRENGDPLARYHPRSKLHDDKTLVRIQR